jgi:hypothetical protein
MGFKIEIQFCHDCEKNLEHSPQHLIKISNLTLPGHKNILENAYFLLNISILKLTLPWEIGECSGTLAERQKDPGSILGKNIILNTQLAWKTQVSTAPGLPWKVSGETWGCNAKLVWITFTFPLMAFKMVKSLILDCDFFTISLTRGHHQFINC